MNPLLAVERNAKPKGVSKGLENRLKVAGICEDSREQNISGPATEDGKYTRYEHLHPLHGRV